MSKRQIDVITTDESPICPRCGKEALLLARMPHGWVNASGELVDGRSDVVLCADCDADAPHAAPLITWFHVHGRVERDNSEEFVNLLVVWTEGMSVPPLDERRLETEVELWRSGNL
ncbi:hypothetical protein ETD86_03465 [Nonomuraea turkmeniaca]|uniref:Uncharacterized protein n=1 Tax=Nonomuraea turkmeniaca TaxID=103838 RepID=A0A5S4FVZ7_9ACTN|nr:DUF6300 family protein [Nonomuraea turkmeniaca]TMR24802.1 hypothetical protein ETD86_03465 [Nonomuraea turkmeniaca]